MDACVEQNAISLRVEALLLHSILVTMYRPYLVHYIALQILLFFYKLLQYSIRFLDFNWFKFCIIVIKHDKMQNAKFIKQNRFHFTTKTCLLLTHVDTRNIFFFAVDKNIIKKKNLDSIKVPVS